MIENIRMTFAVNEMPSLENINKFLKSFNSVVEVNVEPSLLMLSIVFISRSPSSIDIMGELIAGLAADKLEVKIDDYTIERA